LERKILAGPCLLGFWAVFVGSFFFWGEKRIYIDLGIWTSRQKTPKNKMLKNGKKKQRTQKNVISSAKN